MATAPRNEIRYNNWYSAHRRVGEPEAYGDNHTQYGRNPDGSTYEVRPWKDPDNPEFRKLNPEYAAMLRKDRDEARERERHRTNTSSYVPPRPQPLSSAAREAIAFDSFRNSRSSAVHSGLNGMSPGEQRRLYDQWKQRPWGSAEQMRIYSELKKKFG